MCTRRVGVELEISGQTYEEGERHFSGCELGWDTHEDQSIPKVNRDQDCECDRTPLCDHCDYSQENCSCCFCRVTCPDCSRTYSMYQYMYYGRCNTYNCTARHDWAAIRGQCTCRANWGDHCYVPECDCGADERCEGVELVSSPTSDISILNKDLETIYEGLHTTSKKWGFPFAVWDEYERQCCGLHVHVESRDLEGVHKALALHYIQERWPALQQQFPGVLPSFRKDFRFTRWLTPRSNESLAAFYMRARGEERYKSVNITGNKQPHTIEFRVGFVPQTAKEVTDWVAFCRDLVEKIVAIPYSELATVTPDEGLTILENKIKEPEKQEVVEEVPFGYV